MLSRRNYLRYLVNKEICPRCGGTLKLLHKDENDNVHLSCNDCNVLVLTRDYGMYHDVPVKKCLGQLREWVPPELEYDEPTRIMEIIHNDPELYTLWKKYDNIIKDGLKQEPRRLFLIPSKKVPPMDFAEYPTWEHLRTKKKEIREVKK